MFKESCKNVLDPDPDQDHFQKLVGFNWGQEQLC